MHGSTAAEEYRIVWEPSEAQRRGSQMAAFITEAAARSGLDLRDYGALWEWSIEDRAGFWSALWDFAGVVAGRRPDQMPAGATVGTSSLRRQAQLLRLHPGLKIVPIRGNVQTRLSKLTSGEVDAVMSGMTMTPARNLRVAFVGPYMVSGKSILTKSSTLAAIHVGGLSERAALALAAGLELLGAARSPEARALTRMIARAFDAYDLSKAGHSSAI